MKVIKAEVKNIRDSGLDIEINNGLRDFMVTIDKENLTYDELINYYNNSKIKIKVYSMIRNCCAAYPVVVLEKDKNKEEDKELIDVMKNILDIIGKELKNRLEK